MLFVFIISVALIVAFSYLEGKGKEHLKAIQLSNMNLVGNPICNIAAFGILGITAALYPSSGSGSSLIDCSMHAMAAHHQSVPGTLRRTDDGRASAGASSEPVSKVTFSGASGSPPQAPATTVSNPARATGERCRARRRMANRGGPRGREIESGYETPDGR
jgi:hypothetical protein